MISLIPQPAFVESDGSKTAFDRSILIDCDAEARPCAETAAALLYETFGVYPQAFLGPPRQACKGKQRLILKIREEKHGQSREAHEVLIRENEIEISASAAEGLFRGLSTLRQLLLSAAGFPAGPRERIELPVARIRDEPRFSWRGMMLDSSRHLFPVREIKRFIDLLAFHKFNVLHWHLTDDQGWRLEIKKYPRLTEIGAWREESPARTNPSNEGDGIPYGGYYTQDEIHEVVDYARRRFITVVPECDLPGHMSAAIASYPELGVDDVPGFVPRVMTRWGIHEYVLAPKPATFRFLEEVFGEILSLFDSRYIHIGGDEAVKGKDCWRQSPRCMAFMREHGLADADALQSHFIRFAAKLLAGTGRSVIGWDEIMEGGLPEHAAVMAWRHGGIHGKTAASLGRDVIMAPTTHTYFDYRQWPASEEPVEDGPMPNHVITLEKVYSFDPIPPDLPPLCHGRVLGGQGQLWTEYMWNWPRVETMAFPRACALAERLWSKPEGRSWGDFRDRLQEHAKRLDTLGVNYCRRGIG